FGVQKAEDLRRQLLAAGAGADWRLRLDTGVAELQLGNERRGIEILDALRTGLQTGQVQGDIDAAVAASFYLGVAWMRLGETENCCKQAVPESCILPFAAPAQHTATEGSTNACHYFIEVLQNTEPTYRWHLSSQWLLNLAHMTLGTWPDGVPEAWRLPRSTLESAEPVARFCNIAGELGVDTDGNAGGVIVDDFDGDDHLDIVASDWRPDAQLRFFHNNGDGTFVERTEQAGLLGLTGGLNLVSADYDNDGDLDFLVLRGAWWYETGRHPNSLVRNNGDGTFIDVTFGAGLGEVHHPTQAAAWADYDRDGDLDLYIGNEYSQRAPSPSQLFRNNGDGTFADVARTAGVLNGRYAKAVTWGDIDGDGDPDLYVSNADGDNRLYENNGDGTFRDVAEERGVTDPQLGFPTWFFDFDNDGALDLFASHYATDVSHIAAHVLGLPVPYGRPSLYRGDGKGRFREVGAELGLTYPSLPMGANYGDFDNDGWLDIYLGTGDPNYYNLMPNLLYRNAAGRAFHDVTMSSGLGHLQKGHGIAFADIDDDGDLDIFAEMGGAYPSDTFRNALYRNPGFGNHWLSLHLIGTASSRTPIGARIRVVTIEDGRERSIYKHVGSGGSFGCSPMRQIVGLGAAEKIVRVEIVWPRTGKVQVVTGVELDSAVRVVEDR
ncbi:MAG: CRTAC1 family protein, partial [Planctomycetes bacterium]|nr:CRTAC1 family protein [Planctomycetota bacterium]